ncbi:MAG TPA: peptidoglycan DD-metalloendopeptidase family protein [bacterium]|nr:peptidoglycan DD-metalloendopeptidase family protein [bacterium]
MRSGLRVFIGSLALVCTLATWDASAWPSSASTRPLPARTSTPSRAANPQAQLQRVQQQLADRQRQLAKTKHEEHRVLGELSRTEERLHAAETRLKTTAVALTGTKRAVSDASDALRVVSARLAAHEQLMGERLQAFYKDGPLGYLDVLLGAADFRDFVARSYVVGMIVSRDLRLYQQVAEERDRRDAVQTTLKQREADLTTQQQQWIVSRQATAALAAQRRRILAQIRVQRQTQEAAIRELEAESFRIADIIRRQQRGSNRGGRLSLAAGSIIWPASGPVSCGFGWRIDPIFHRRALHTGIDIAASWGAPVAAAEAGTVLYVGWMTGYGNVVVLDHGNGVSTVYAHLSSYAVRTGESVRRGQVIARVGSTGWSTGPHLHFEVRQNGQPVDPLAP